MKITEPLLRSLIVCALWTILFSGFAMGAEFRVWKDLKGRSLNAKLVKMDGDEVVLVFKNGQEVRVERSKLSPEDNRFLDENKGAGKKLEFSLFPEKDVKIDTKTFKKLEEPFMLPNYPVKFEGIETEHFLVITDGRARLEGLAETAERMWYGMKVRHPSFAGKWGDRRNILFFVEDLKVQESLGEWVVKRTEEMGNLEFAQQLNMGWKRSTRWSFFLPTEFTEKHHLIRLSPILKPGKGLGKDYLDVFSPGSTDFLADTLLFFYTGGMRDSEGRGSYSIIAGHGLLKGLQLSGKIGRGFTNPAFEADSMVPGAEFEELKEWPSILKKLIRKRKITPEIQFLYAFDEDGRTPDSVLLIYGFNYYMHSTPERVKSYARLIEAVAATQRIPPAIELAEIFGFKTVEDFQKDWVEFLESRAFD